ncbi:MAG TPA: hypothetical protein VK524_05900, partial [Polyangiaceae bacterium]|nr:hypothetical protein [Polyangiaceae bacterium]
MLLFGWEAFRKVSVLNRPDAIVPRNDRQNQLIGREHQVASLVELCKSSRLIFLRGMSGVGKSAVVISGLIPELKAGRDFFPIYLSTWGVDWESGPLDELSRVTLVALRETPLQLSAAPSGAELPRILGDIRKVLGLNPVLIFDQFDEYQARHKRRFVNNGVWISPEWLCERNQFWKIVNDILSRGLVTCIFVVRIDSELGMLKFGALHEATRTFDLFPLDRRWVDVALRRLTDL